MNLSIYQLMIFLNFFQRGQQEGPEYGTLLTGWRVYEQATTTIIITIVDVNHGGRRDESQEFAVWGR